MSGAAFTAASKLALFAAHSKGPSLAADSEVFFCGRYRFYYCRVYDKDDRLIHNYVPARDNTAGEGALAQYGVWDSVTEQFFPNLGSFTFDTTGAQVLGPLGKADSPEREVAITEYSSSEVAGSDYEVTLAFSNPGFAQRIFLGWSSTAVGGEATNTWEHVEQLSDVRSDEVTRIVPLPVGARYVRFFLQPILPEGAKAVRYLQSSGDGAYINTEFTPDSNSRADYHITMVGETGTFMVPFGSRQGGVKQFWIGVATGTGTSANYWFLRSSDLGQVQVFDPNWPGEHFISIDHNQYKIDDYVHWMKRTTFTCPGPAYIFAVNNDGASLFANMKLHSCSIWDDGTLVRNYVPCVKADGITPALYDAVADDFSVNAGATSTRFTCGEELWTCSAVTEIGSDVPVRAEWSGNGRAGDFSDYRNWICWNFAGNILEEKIPNRDTDVEVKGTTTFSCPTGSVLVCKSISFDCALAGNADLRGLDPSLVAAAMKIDLNGHTLHVAELEGEGLITNTDSAVAELHVDVAKDKTVVNSQFAIGGNVKFVKDGEGTFVPAKYNQTYTGGNVVKGGVLKLNSSSVIVSMATAGCEKPLGETLSQPIVVMTNAFYDISGLYDTYLVPVELAGGTLRNSKGMSYDANRGAIDNVTVTADGALFDFQSDTVIRGSNIDLGGHVLEVNGVAGMHRYMNGGMTNGTLKVTSGGWCMFNGTFFAPTVDVIANAAFSLYNGDVTVRNLTVIYDLNFKEGNRAVNILGVFTPSAHNYLNNFVLHDGATLNLADWSGAYDIATSVTGQKLGFAAGKPTVYVSLGGRKVSSGEKVVAWDVDKAPDVKFEPVSGSDYVFVKRAGGLYVVRGFAIMVR